MARRWTKREESKYRSELFSLYIKQNKALHEVAKILGVTEQTVFQRLGRLGIKTQPHLKKNYLKKRADVYLPRKYSENLAEFFGIMLGDGHVSHFQIIVSLGNKEKNYTEYVRSLITKIFKTKAKISLRSTGYRDVYLGSVAITSWLLKQGLVFNKVKSQVDIPKWVFKKPKFIKRFLRGFFDTDGSVYKIRFGIQISLNNKSRPMLKSLHKLLSKLEYQPSAISADKIYFTKITDVKRFFAEIKPKNQKHQERFEQFVTMRGSDSGYSSGL
ncbi:MAG: LAGLIDADG family homing endonuclease [Patescibacteria group bacterium]